MLRLLKKKAQSATEYAILIGIIIGAVVAMQTWISQRLKGRMYEASQYNPDTTGNYAAVFKTERFEPTDTGSYFITNRVSPIAESRTANGEIIRAIDTSGEITTRTGNVTYHE